MRMALPVPVLEVRSVGKAYGPQVVLSGVGLSAGPGDVHALLGGNGAGKSTLLKILAGAVRPDSGEVRLDGQRVHHRSPADALGAGIALMHQEPALAAHLSVAANIFLGREPRRWSRLPVIDHRRLHAEAGQVLESIGCPLDPAARVDRLGTAQRQMVDIARAVAAAQRVLLMDEPTAALSPRETSDLFALVHRLQQRGMAVVYVTHRLAEVPRLATHVSILRDGRIVHSGPVDGLSSADMVRHIVGRPATDEFPPRGAGAGHVRLGVAGLRIGDRIGPVSFQVAGGDIVGLVGLPDAGCRDLLEGLYGSQTARTGTVSIDGRPLPRLSPRASLGRRLALLTDDRMATGLLPDRPLRENISVAALALQPRQGRALRAHEDALTAMGIAQCDIRPADPGRPMAFFSGGNQQKALIARWIATDASVFLLNEPTRGVDAGARADIYRLLRSLAAAGASVLVHSSDIRELLGLTDRLLVMHRGQIIAEHASDAVSEPQLLAEASLGTGAQP